MYKDHFIVLTALAGNMGRDRTYISGRKSSFIFPAVFARAADDLGIVCSDLYAHPLSSRLDRDLFELVEGAY